MSPLLTTLIFTSLLCLAGLPLKSDAGVDYEEGKLPTTTIDAVLASESGIRARNAEPGTIERTVNSYGRLVPNPNAMAHVRARFDGKVKQVAQGLGDRVAVNDVLATIESNQSLKPYRVRAPIAGTITARHITVGELTQGQELFVITNLKTLWVKLKLFPKQSKEVAPGNTVRLEVDGKTYHSRIKHLLPGPDGTPYLIAHAELDNSAGALSPGRLVSADIVLATLEAPLAIENRALQTFRGSTVAFVQVGNTFEVRPLTTGPSDGQLTEVKTGLEPGDRYVVDNSYLIKADIEKSGASHAH